MKIVKLVSENVKRLSAVAIEPGDAGLVIVGGKNGAGKSSVLDSVAYALGGKELVPSEPIRKGEAEAKIVVDLGDVIVTRKFKRNYLECDCAAHPDEPDRQMEHSVTCASNRFGATISTLVVTNKDGAKYPSPQAMLDKLLGRLTFDPLAFARDEPKRQSETLRKLTNLDFGPLDAKRKDAFDARAMATKSLKAVMAQLEAMPHHPEAPAEEIGADAVQAELQKAEELRKEASAAADRHRAVVGVVSEVSRLVEDDELEISRLTSVLAERQELRTAHKAQLAKAEENAIMLGANAVEAVKAVPDVSAINARLTEIAAVNKRVRENALYCEKADRAKALSIEQEQHAQAIAALDEQRANTLAAVSFPVAGLGLSDDGVTFEGIPLEQASSSEQLRVSVAIGLALNPQLKVLLVRNGNLLDDDGIKALGAMAEEVGAQVWCEYVTADAEGVTVMIEDGHTV